MERGGGERRRARPVGAKRLASDRAELWEGSPGRARFIHAGPSTLRGKGASGVPHSARLRGRSERHRLREHFSF